MPRIVAPLVGLLLLASTGGAGAEDCDDARDNYREAVSEVDQAVRRYASCVDSSHGEKDCSSEFRNVRDAHSDFEKRVKQFRDECD